MRSENVAYASFIEDDFRLVGMVFQFAAEAVDIFLEKRRVGPVIWPPDIVEQVFTSDYPSLTIYQQGKNLILNRS